MTGSIKIVAILTARPGKVDALQNLLHTMLASSRTEPGNLRYDLWIDRAEPGRFVLDELYADADALAAHHASAYFQFYLASINNLAERSAFTLDPLAIA